MGVMLKKLRIRRVLSRKIENLVRKKVQGWRKQPKPIKQRILTWKRKCSSSLSSYLLHLLLYFSCLGSILIRIMGEVNNTIRRFVSNKILRKQLKPRNGIYTWRHADHGRRAVMQFLNDLSINLSGLVDSLRGFSLFQVLLSECWNCGMIWRLLSNKIQMEELECGDQIYTWRRAYSYAHHGIYSGNGMVYHYTRGGSLLGSSPSHHSNSTHPSSSDQSRLDRVIRSSIDDFLSGGELYRFEYGVNLALFIAKTGGTCTLACSDPPELVQDRAHSFLENKNGFGKYHLLGNNCEDFAIFCKTGFHLVDNSFSIGRSGQAASFLNSISDFISVTSQHFIGQTLSFLVYINAFVSSILIVGYSIYSACRWACDTGIRRNVSKAANSRLSVEESSGYGVGIKFTSVFLKGLAWDFLVFATWWICCYVLELTTEITSFQLGWIILTSTICRLLFVPVMGSVGLPQHF